MSRSGGFLALVDRLRHCCGVVIVGCEGSVGGPRVDVLSIGVSVTTGGGVAASGEGSPNSTGGGVAAGGDGSPNFVSAWAGG